MCWSSRGTEPAFCAGLDLPELASGRLHLDRDFFGPIRALPAVVIAAVNGPAVTGGLELALACDIRVASDRARFADTHARIGIAPGDGITAELPRLVGPSRARMMSLTSDFVDAARADLWGLVDEVVPHANLIPHVLALAANIATIDPAVGRHVHELMDESAGVPLDCALDLERSRLDAFLKGFDVEAALSRSGTRVR
jgi:enoyl-CoA hydratase